MLNMWRIFFNFTLYLVEEAEKTYPTVQTLFLNHHPDAFLHSTLSDGTQHRAYLITGEEIKNNSFHRV